MKKEIKIFSHDKKKELYAYYDDLIARARKCGCEYFSIEIIPDKDMFTVIFESREKHERWY